MRKLLLGFIFSTAICSCSQKAYFKSQALQPKSESTRVFQVKLTTVGIEDSLSLHSYYRYLSNELSKRSVRSTHSYMPTPTQAEHYTLSLVKIDGSNAPTYTKTRYMLSPVEYKASYELNLINPAGTAVWKSYIYQGSVKDFRLSWLTLANEILHNLEEEKWLTQPRL